MAKFVLYKPSLIKYTVFWSQEKDFNIYEAEAESGTELFEPNTFIIEEEDFIILVTSLPIQSMSTAQDAFQELAMPDIQLTLTSSELLTKKYINTINGLKRQIFHMGTYSLLVAGAAPDHWLEAESTTGPTVEWNTQSTKSRLTTLAEGLGASKALYANSISAGNQPSTIFGLGSYLSEEREMCPEIFVLNINIDGMALTDDSFTPTRSDEERYNTVIKTHVVDFGRLLAYYSKLEYIRSVKLKKLTKTGSKIRTDVQKLGNAVNDLLTSAERAQEKGIFVERGSEQQTEEQLLLQASRSFSDVTNLERQLGMMLYDIHENTKKIEKLGTTLGMERVKFEGKESLPSLFADFLRFASDVDFLYRNLREESNNAESGVRNTVDVLKTFLEGQQRIASERSEKAIGLLSVVLACFGILDAIGNFMVYYLQEGKTFQAGLNAFMYFILSTAPVILMILIIYFGYLRRRWE